jgi:hypothetical protein
VSERPARRLFAGFVAAYGLGLLAWLLWPAFRDSWIGSVVAIPGFSIYVLEHLGVPGLTDRRRCDWMWCTPTVLGIVVVAIVWLAVAWLVSVGIMRLRRSAPSTERP